MGGDGGGIMGIFAAQRRLQGNSLAGAAMDGPGMSAAERTRNVETAYHKETRRIMAEMRETSDPDKIDACLDKLDKLRDDMHKALDHIKDTSGCQDTQVVDQARANLESSATDAEKWMLDKQWGGTAPDFLKRPKVEV